MIRGGISQLYSPSSLIIKSFQIDRFKVIYLSASDYLWIKIKSIDTVDDFPKYW